MSNTASASVNAKMGLAGWLTLVFVILKLNPGGYLDSAVQDWSWWLVFSPILIGVAFVLLLLIIGAGVFGGAALLDWRSKKRRQKDQKVVQNMTMAERREYFASKRRR